MSLQKKVDTKNEMTKQTPLRVKCGKENTPIKPSIKDSTITNSHIVKRLDAIEDKALLAP